MKRGLIYGAITYGLWGLSPLYWKQLHNVLPIEVLAHRVVWSLFIVGLILLYKRRGEWIRPSLHNPRLILTYVASVSLLVTNWGLFIWGVNAGFIVEISLGYFINPLVNVLFGFIFLGERLRLGQILAILIAMSGVAYLTINYGTVPWIALILATTFGLYGLIRKTAPLEAIEGFSMEMAVLFLPALSYLIYRETVGIGSFGHVSTGTTLLLMLAGVATAVPLILFGAAARRISLTNLGLLQYIAPTLQFLIGVYVYGEPFETTQKIGFGIVWFALFIYVGESLRHYRRGKRPLLKPT